MNIIKTLAPVAIAAALALTACTPSHTPAVTAYVPATITTPTAPAPALDTITAPTVKLAPAKVKVATAPRCEEDQPCWNCQTMGNKICGPVAQAPAPAVASAVVYMPKAHAPARIPAQAPIAKVVKHVPAPAPKHSVPVPPCNTKGSPCTTKAPTGGPFVEGGPGFAPITRAGFNAYIATCNKGDMPGSDPAACIAYYTNLYLNKIMD